MPCFWGPAQVPHSHGLFLPEAPQPLEFLRTSLGGRFLVYESFLYRKEKAAGEKVYWMCRDQARKGCRSRAITQGPQVTIMRSHCHPPDLAGLEALRQRERLPSLAQQEDPGTDRAMDEALCQAGVQTPQGADTVWGALFPGLPASLESPTLPPTGSFSWIPLSLSHPFLGGCCEVCGIFIPPTGN